MTETPDWYFIDQNMRYCCGCSRKLLHDQVSEAREIPFIWYEWGAWWKSSQCHMLVSFVVSISLFSHLNLTTSTWHLCNSKNIFKLHFALTFSKNLVVEVFLICKQDNLMYMSYFYQCLTSLFIMWSLCCLSIQRCSLCPHCANWYRLISTSTATV